MIESITKDAENRMKKSLDALQEELSKLRTGRAHPDILSHVKVTYYGAEMPVNQVANITATDAQTLTVKPWEKSMVPVIEKAIVNSDLGLNPVAAGEVLRVPMPPLNEERRKELVRVVKNEAENARIAVRNVRRDANSEIKRLAKESEISEDDQKRAEDRIQSLTDQYVKKIDDMLEKKEQDLMEF